MKIKVLQNFEGYPDGVYRQFGAGEVVDDLDEAYAKLLVDKGHAEALETRQPSLPLIGGGRGDAE